MKTDLAVLNLICEFEKVEVKYLRTILEAKEDFEKRLIEEKSKLPYSINLLDEIHANENSHSRIFAKLLHFKQIKQNQKLAILHSFLEYLGPPFSKLHIEKPEITAEKNRIDVRIREKKKYSIIVENKIKGAPDQYKQVERYIKNEKTAGYNEKNIHVLYLTEEGGSPDEISISKQKRDEMGDRYKEINYRDDILQWLDKKTPSIIAEIKKSGNTQYSTIESAVIQYIDHLKGLFDKREGEKEMKNAMIKLVNEKLKLNTDISEIEKLKQINDYLEYTKELLKYLDENHENTIKSVLLEFAEKTCKKRIPGINTIRCHGKFGEEGSSIEFKPIGWDERYSISISFQNYLSNLFYAIGDSNGTHKTKNNPFIDNLKSILGENDEPNDLWPYCKWIIDIEKKEISDIEKLITLLVDENPMSDALNHIAEIAQNEKIRELLKG